MTETLTPTTHLTKIPTMGNLEKLDDKTVRAAALAAIELANEAGEKALLVGQYFLEKKASCPHGVFMKWRKQVVPEISENTAERWMNVARRVGASALAGSDVLMLEDGTIEVEGEVMSVSSVLTSDVAGLSEPARKVRQLLFDFVEGKTMKECLAGVVVGGNEAHSITRAHNGAAKGGTRGENRKDWPTFIGRKLSDVSGHLSHWRSFSGAQVELMEGFFKKALAKWPTAVLEQVRKQITEEMKGR